jgi:two-component system, chemotaxis family, CheB/CheR fusion protein
VETLQALFVNMPADADIAFAVIQHLSLQLKSFMAELLAKHTSVPVKQIEDDMPPKRCCHRHG